MKKKLLIAVALLTLMVVLAACREAAPSNRRAFVGGNAGLLINFEDDAPPSDYVTAGGTFPFSVGVKLENKGERSVLAEDVTVELKGVDLGDFGYTDEARLNPDGDLLAVRLNPDTGATEEFAPSFVFYDLNYGPNVPGNHEFPIVVDVCYKYQTSASADLCIKKNLLDTRDESVCTVTGPKRFENSGAPIGIANFQEFTQGQDKIRFTFEVKGGSGDIYLQDTECAYDARGNLAEERALEDVVIVTVDPDLGPNVTCQGFNETCGSDCVRGYVKLIGGSKLVACTVGLSEDDMVDKIKLVNITLDYDFQDTIATTVLVKPSGQ